MQIYYKRVIDTRDPDYDPEAMGLEECEDAKALAIEEKWREERSEEN